MPGNGAPRHESWARFDDATKLSLAINDIDQLEAQQKQILSKVNWLLTTAVTILIGMIANLAILLITR